MYFNLPVAIPRIYRLLKNEGCFCILFMAWLPDESEIAQKSEELVLKYNPVWSGGHMKRYQLAAPEWSKDFFTVENALTFDLNVTFTHESWHGRMKVCRRIGASSLNSAEISAWEKEHIAMLSEFPEVFDIMHFATILDLKKCC